MKRILLIVLILSATKILNGQIFSSNDGGIVAEGNNQFTDFEISVSQLDSMYLNESFGLIQVCFQIQHGDLSQIKVELISPEGKKLNLANGLNGANCNVCLNSSARQYIGFGWGPYSGTHRALSNIGKLNDGGKSNGIWKMRIYDPFVGVQGHLISWSIQFGKNPPKPAPPFKKTALPILKINTKGQRIVDHPKRIVQLELIDKDLQEGNHFNDPPQWAHDIGIEIRGSSSQWFPKKSFGFEFVDSLGEDKKIGMLGMPAESDWILSANFTDKSFLNNVLAYHLYRGLGRYASRTRFVELVIDEEHQGLYVLMEKIKQDDQRVDISKLTETDTAGSDLTGGYILKIDKSTGGSGAGWVSKYPPPVHPNNQTIYYQYHYPSEENIKDAQKKYIEEFVRLFETSLMEGPLNQRDSGWRKFADEPSFIHYLLLNEISRNTDGYRLSTFLYKTKDTKGNKLHIGPPWDYDIAFGNINYCDGQKVTGWAFDFGNICPGDHWQIPFWWNKLLADSLFVNALQCEYKKLRANSWSNENLNQLIDQYIDEIQASLIENFDIWSILGCYIWPNPDPLPGNLNAEIIELKNWLFRRMDWMDQNLPGICIVSHDQNPIKEAESIELKISPNPVKDWIQIQLSHPEIIIQQLEVFDAAGRLVHKIKGQNMKNQLAIPANLHSGFYGLKITLENQQVLHKTFVKE
ncbi:MAG: CotH kinase family protein [Saprospiraceae bacterium]|nr:CotH kinase family protein [Saprospiraceae bacterium]